MLADGDTTANLRVVSGVEEPLQGWVSPAWREALPAPTLVLDRPGRNWSAATVFRLHESDEHTLGDLVTTRDDDGALVRFTLDGAPVEIHIGAAKPLAVRVTLPALSTPRVDLDPSTPRVDSDPSTRRVDSDDEAR
jgi:hypothetical protein